MNITLVSLEALVLKATHESLTRPDSAAIEAFLSIMRDAGDGPQLAAQALAARMHSGSAQEALLALDMVEECLHRGDHKFLAEIGKFRFLNELIMLVSPKYLAGKTAPQVKSKVIQLFHKWSNKYESKFKIAYDMLINQGVVKDTLHEEPEVRPKRGIVFEDQEKCRLLQKLLQSKKPEDLQHANRLIKIMVREDERRNEAHSQCMQKVSAALDSAELLQEMLLNAKNPTSDEEQLIQEMSNSCKKMLPILHQLASANLNTENLTTILHANDALSEALGKHKQFVQRKLAAKIAPPTITEDFTSADNLLDFAGARGPEATTNTCYRTSLDELGDLLNFNECRPESSSETLNSTVIPHCILEPEEVVITSGKNNTADGGWGELDYLGEQMMMQSLPGGARNDVFSSKNSKKIPMNTLDIQTRTKRECDNASSSNESSRFDMDFFTKKYESHLTVTDANDDLILDISTNFIQNFENKTQQTSPCGDATGNATNDEDLKNQVQNSEVLHEMRGDSVRALDDINVMLSEVRPSRVPPYKAFEEPNGLTIVLHFCCDRPRSDVNVIVVTTSSRKTVPIEDYTFHAFVPKRCKLRLLPPSGTSFPPANPFLAPPSITQLLLVARPSGQRPADSFTLKYLFTYTCEDETISEIGEVNNLPLDKI